MVSFVLQSVSNGSPFSLIIIGVDQNRLLDAVRKGDATSIIYRDKLWVFGPSFFEKHEKKSVTK